MSVATGGVQEYKASTSTSSIQRPGCRHFKFPEILIATKNFDDLLIIGSGGFGKVYKGDVTDGSNITVAAIKRLDAMSNQGETEFWAEVEMLSMLRHCNLVSLIGYCNYEKEKILVYEYMPNGTLDDHLHKLCSPLTWLQRLNICIGAGRGLHYLHTGTGIDSGVIHRDFKSSNILLHESWAAKISDFGLSRIGPTNQPSTYVNTHVKGSFGYFDPNYFQTGKLTRKSDVYAFGVVLLEVLCRKRAVDKRLEEGLVTWVQDSIKEGNLKHIIDSDIRGEISPKCLKEFIRIAERCLHNSPKQRPAMAEVLFSLESSLAIQEKFNISLQSAGKSVFGRMVNLFPFSSNGESSGAKLSSNIEGNNMFSEAKEVPADFQSPIPGVKEFRFDDLEKATRNFSLDLLLGEGGFGKVFLGWVDQNTLAPSNQGVGIEVAVKWFDKESVQGRFEWLTEVNWLRHLGHPNIIRLLGYCKDKAELLLVYEYMPNLSFDHVLFKDTTKRLSWETRILIMIGVARGLAYLHSIDLVFGDLKSSKILLDKDFNAKLGDFVLVNHGNVQGSFGYLDPSYYSIGKLTSQSDVYAFGVVMLELLCRKRAVVGSLEEGLVTWVQHQIIKGDLKHIIDSDIRGEMSPKCLIEFVRIAERCLHNSPKQRPTMAEVMSSLESELAIQEKFNISLQSNGESSAISIQGDLRLSSYSDFHGLFASVKKFSYDDIKRATQDFTTGSRMGEGGTGEVFLGWVDQNTLAPSDQGVGIKVAVRNLCDAYAEDCYDWLKRVIEESRHLVHPNIVRLLGYCNNYPWHILVYEYVPNLSFDHVLFKDTTKQLSWGTRISIMIGVARGLAYLHSRTDSCWDLEARKILLDEDFNAKLGDLGLIPGPEIFEADEKWAPPVTYREAQKHIKTGHLYTKSDIYRFGVVLLEAISGQKVLDYNQSKEQQALVKHATQIKLSRRKLQNFIDQRLKHKYPLEGAFECIALALRCIAEEPEDMPSINEILKCLEQIYAQHK